MQSSYPGLSLVESVIGGLLVVSMMFVLGYLLTRASHSRNSSEILLVTLSVLTMTSMVLFAITGSEILATISATGVGSLAGGITSLFKDPKDK